MSREIKFKFWLGHTKKMTYEHSLIDIAHSHWDFTEDIIPLQYTGLKDKKGNEIYEGDLIHRHMNVFWKVSFKDSKWIADELKPISGLYLDASQFIEAEVIGNIYEKPELISERS